MFRAEIIDDTDHQNQPHRRDRRVLARDAKIADRRPSAQGRGDNKIRDEQERTGRCQKAALLPRRGIDAAAIRKMGADDDVVEADDRGEQADREDDRHGRKAGGDKGEADDVRLARAPIAVKQRGGALPIDVARAMDCRAGR